MKVYLVSKIWSYDGCPDDYANTWEDKLEKIFLNEKDAKEYIKNTINGFVEYNNAIKEAKRKECFQKCWHIPSKDLVICDGCLAFYSDGGIISEFISESDIIKDTEIEYRCEYGEHYSYIYEEWNVD